jgi:hypothetical protein
MVRFLLLALLITFSQRSCGMQVSPQMQHPVSRKFELFCKFLEEDMFQEELHHKKSRIADYKAYTLEERIALTLTDEEFEKMNKVLLRSSIRVLLLKYPPVE